MVSVAFKDSSLEICSLGIALRFSEVEWDTRVLGKPVLHLEEFRLETPGDLDVAQVLVDASEALNSKHFLLTARIPADELHLRHVMGQLGFQFVELTLHPRFEVAGEGKFETVHRLRHADAADLPTIQKEASGAFEYSRFFRDPLVPRALAARRFENWVESAFWDSTKRVLIFDHIEEQVPQAFFIDRLDGDRRFIELTAIYANQRGRGLSASVWRSYLEEQRADRVREVRTNISAENSKVVALYPKLGFRFEKPSVVLHLHT